MDGRGRLAQSLMWRKKIRGGKSAAAAMAWGGRGSRRRERLRRTRTAFGRFLERQFAPLMDVRLPRGTGVALMAMMMLAIAGYGVVRGGHAATVVGELAGLRDGVANAAGFRISTIALSGNRQVTREEILTIAGVTGRSSLLFLDVDDAREKLKTNPWIADATVLKLYPGELKIAIQERKPFALWQKNRRVSVIASDGTVLEPYVARRFTVLPLVVGKGAELRAQEFLAVVDRYRDIRHRVRAAVLVAERRWNLRLDNGIDVRLPESNIEEALTTLVKLDRAQKLLSRDIEAVDLRLTDRVTVRLSDAAAAARAEELKPKQAKRKGGDA
jgi:cell division protein FtsQ